MYITIALSKGRLMKDAQPIIYSISGFGRDNFDTRKLIIEDDKNKIRYIILKPADVPIYVKKGIADLGIVGKDVLMESGVALYEVMNFDFGKCKFSIAALDKNKNIYEKGILKVATKYPIVAKKYFGEKNQNIDIIKLNGSVELAPMVGLSDVIVDIVETGGTLKANGLWVIEDMYKITAKLVSNKLSYRVKNERINEIVRAIEMGGI